MKSASSYLPAPYILVMCLFMVFPARAAHEDALDRMIRLPQSKGTVYKLLEIVTDISGYHFIYDSEIIDNEQESTLEDGDYTIRQAIYQITGNTSLTLEVIGSHVAIRLPAKNMEPASLPEEAYRDTLSTYFTLEGTLIDKYTKTPIPFATIGIPSDGIGTVTNQNGDFRLRIPDSLHNTSIHFSHIGYVPLVVGVDSLAGQQASLLLEPKVISLQEIVVRLVNPQRLIRDMLENRKENYATRPVYITSFYREGIERKKGFVNLTEAVFKIYKQPFDHPVSSDQIKLLKMRRISNEAEKDTFITKFKSGINASLLLDVIKHLPDFLDEDGRNLYNYLSTDITVIDNRLANVISFEQKKGIKDPLYKGELYIDSKNDALLTARFDIHPKYVEKAVAMLVVKKSRNISIKPRKVTYTVSYKEWNGTYYIHHIRGDLYFRIKQKKQWFGSTDIHTWFEMVTCKIETDNVGRFNRSETLPTRTVFSDTNFVYDESFWGDFNVIPPEEELNKAIRKITSKIEETGK